MKKAEATSWRKARDRRRAVPRHRWQRGQSATGGIPAARRGRRRLRIAGWFALFLLGVGLFVNTVLFTPVRTPVIAIVGGPYQWPYPPNRWAREDLDRLEELDAKTLSILDTSAAWQSTRRGLRALRQQLGEQREQALECGVIIIWISMHGAVNDAGVPCLIPPGAPPHDARRWLPIPELFETIRQTDLPSRVHKLVIFDANRMLVNWNIGLLANGFADGLNAAVAEAKIPNLVVLNSTSPGERGWAGDELQGSVFGYFVRRGLAGAADGALGSEADDRISLHELAAYARRNVDAYVRGHRGARQRPLLLPVDAEDFQIAWTAENGTPVSSGGAAALNSDPPVSGAEIDDLWARRDALPVAHLQHRRPVAWHHLQHQLLWLEQAASAGSAYEALAQQTYAAVSSQLDGLERTFGKAATSQSAGKESRQIAPPPPVHHIPLVNLLDRSETESADAARSVLRRLQAPSPSEKLTVALRSLADRRDLWRFDQIHFARLLARHHVLELWRRPDLIAQVLQIREEAIDAEIPEDPRVQFWTKQPLASADALRRHAEDLLFLGPTDAVGDVGAAWKSVATTYERVSELGSTIAKGLRLRDRGWARVPYLAQWILHPLHDSDESDEVEETLLSLIEHLHRLSLALAAGPGNHERPSAELERLTPETRQQLDLLEQQFQETVQRLLARSRPSARACREIVALLTVPLTTAEQRRQLRQKLAEFSSELSAIPAGKSREFQSAIAKVEPSTSAARHPVLAILGREWLPIEAPHDDSVGQDARRRDETLATQGRRVRMLLATLPEERRAWRNRFAARGSGDEEPSFPFRPGWPQAELVRIAASFSLQRRNAKPITRLRALDLQRLLLQQTQRVLDDFYGPVLAEQRPFFARAATDYLQAAQTIAEPTARARNRIAALQDLLAARVQAAETALTTTGDPILLINSQTSVTTHLAVRATTPANSGALPAGRAALFLRERTERIPGSTQVLRLPLAPAGSIEFDRPGTDKDVRSTYRAEPVEFDAELAGTSLAGRSPRLTAVTLFRGNEFRASVPLTSAGGFVLTRKSPPARATSVTLRGPGREQLAVVFVLDCSSSMSAATELEAPAQSSSPPPTKMAVAKRALRTMLDQLVARGDVRVGVWLFGHRAGWSTSEPTRILRQAEYGRPIPDGLSPNRDVEAIQHLGRFDRRIADSITNLMPSVQPWGQTPLYYALVQALRDFSGEDPQTQKIIIVITDGLNYQYNALDPTTQADVLTTWSRQHVPIYLVGFGIPERDAAAAYEQFTQLAEQTGGGYRTPAVSATSLIDSLESLLAPSRYRLVEAGGDLVGAADLNTALDIPAGGGWPRRLIVASGEARQPITLWGGEALQLVLDRGGAEIRSIRYEKGDPVVTELVSGSPPHPSGLVLGVPRPVRTSQGLRLTVFLERSDGEVTERPRMSWIEVTPVFSSSKKQGRPLLLYRPNVVPGMPVPVLSWQITGWPAGADRASIRFGCRMVPSEPALSMEAGALYNDASPETEVTTSPILEGIHLTAHPVRDAGKKRATLQVLEEHPRDSATFEPLKITATLPGQPPIITSRRIDPKHRLAVHRWTFQGVTPEQLAGVQLQITSRSLLRQGALRAARPVEVEISTVNGLIAPTDNAQVLNPPSLVK